MAENKTKPTDADVHAFIDGVENAGRREDARVLLDLMTRLSGEKPRMWGPTMIGFGEYHYVYESGREGDFFRIGFAPRKANMVVYIMPGFSNYKALLKRLGKYKTGASCLYVGRLKSVDMDVLAELIQASLAAMQKKYGS